MLATRCNLNSQYNSTLSCTVVNKLAMVFQKMQTCVFVYLLQKALQGPEQPDLNLSLVWL